MLDLYGIEVQQNELVYHDEYSYDEVAVDEFFAVDFVVADVVVQPSIDFHQYRLVYTLMSVTIIMINLKQLHYYYYSNRSIGCCSNNDDDKNGHYTGNILC